MATPVSDRLRDAMNGHDIDAFVGCFTPDYRSVQPAHPERLRWPGPGENQLVSDLP